MKVITLSNQKGGVAKTTTSQALASGLVKRGYRVLCVDLDPQSNLSLSSGVDILSLGATLYDVFKGSAEIREAINTQTAQGYDLITGGLSLASADMDFTQTGREYMLREALDGVRELYDFVIIDTPPTLGILTVNALTASDGVVIPLTADLFSLQGLSQLNMLIQRVKKYSNQMLRIYGLLITNHDVRTNISKSLSDKITQTAERLGTKVLHPYIRHSVAVREAQASMSDLLTEAPQANATTDYTEFTNELLKEVENNGK